MTRLPQGFTNSVAIFERVMSRVLGRLKGTVAETMVDDITVHARTRVKDETLRSNGCREFVSQIIEATEDVLRAMINAGLTISVDKAGFGISEAEILGATVGIYGRKLGSKLAATIASWGKPTVMRELRGFLAVVNISQVYVPFLAETLAPLSDLTRGKPRSDSVIPWRPEHELAFLAAKKLFQDNTCLKNPDESEGAPPYQVYSDAGEHAVGSALMQEDSEII